jgi:enamine deaminase RidA (YjgF/YER057c/UK114 family)
VVRFSYIPRADFCLAGRFLRHRTSTGFDDRTMTIADGLEEQTEQCLKNIDTAFREAGSSLRDVRNIE